MSIGRTHHLCNMENAVSPVTHHMYRSEEHVAGKEENGGSYWRKNVWMAVQGEGGRLIGWYGMKSSPKGAAVPCSQIDSRSLQTAYAIKKILASDSPHIRW